MTQKRHCGENLLRKRKFFLYLIRKWTLFFFCFLFHFIFHLTLLHYYYFFGEFVFIFLFLFLLHILMGILHYHQEQKLAAKLSFHLSMLFRKSHKFKLDFFSFFFCCFTFCFIYFWRRMIQMRRIGGIGLLTLISSGFVINESYFNFNQH